MEQNLHNFKHSIQHHEITNTKQFSYGVRQMQTCRLALGSAKLELLLAKLALRIGIGI